MLILNRSQIESDLHLSANLHASSYEYLMGLEGLPLMKTGRLPYIGPHLN